MSEASIRPQYYHAHFDCFSGAAGDMLLAACLDAADSLPHPLPRLEAADANVEVAIETTKQSERLLAQISHDLENGLSEMKGEFELSVERVFRGSGRIAAKKLHVKSIYQHEAAPVPGTDSHSHNHHHSHEHNNNHHSHEHSHSKGDSKVEKKDPRPQQESNLHHSHHHHNHSSSNQHNHSHHHSHQGEGEEAGHSHSKLRNLSQIVKMLKAAPSKYIPPTVASLAIGAFTALAHAEMHTHGAESIDQVHFHEVGAVDSIVDTVGTLLALHYLSVDFGSGITCSRLPMGEGTVWTDHGLLPVPAPATMRLMIGMPTCQGPSGVTGELVTPTAAALLRVVTGVNSQAEKGQHSEYWQPKVIDGRPPSMIPRGVGLGAGSKDFERHPNVLRLILGDCKTQKQTDTEKYAHEEIAATAAKDEEGSSNHIEIVSSESGKSEEGKS